MKTKFYALLLVKICATLILSCSNQNKSTTPEYVLLSPNSTLEKAETVKPDETSISVNYSQPAGYLQKKLSKYLPKEQKFTIDPQKRERLTCTAGTILTFDPGIFVYQSTGLPVTEPTEIAVTEYLTDADIIMSGLTTKSGDHIIETGGMIYLTASADGKQLSIKNGECYQIEIPADVEKEGMEVFYGEGEGNDINWISANYGRIMRGNRSQAYFGSYQEIKSNGFRGGLRAMYDYLHKEVPMPDGFEFVRLSATSYVNFYLDSQGGIYKVYTSNEIKTYADSQMVKAFELMPCWNSDIDYGEYLKMMVPVKLDLVRDPTQIPARLIMNYQPNGNKFTANYINDKYLMTSAKLGWINCDRFMQPNRATTDLFVALDSTYDASVRLVFSDIRAVLPGTRYTSGYNFSGVPINTDVTIVAMRNVDNKMEVAIKKCSTNMVNVGELTFVVMTPEQMEIAFNNLNNAPELTAMSNP